MLVRCEQCHFRLCPKRPVRFACIASAQTVVKCRSQSLHAASVVNELLHGLIVCKSIFATDNETNRNAIISATRLAPARVLPNAKALGPKLYDKNRSLSLRTRVDVS